MDLNALCKKHPYYTSLRRPRAKCRACWAMWKLIRLVDKGEVILY